MRLSLVHLIKSLRGAMWRASLPGERLRVEASEGGSVRLWIDLNEQEVIDDRPSTAHPVRLGHATPKT